MRTRLLPVFAPRQARAIAALLALVLIADLAFVARANAIPNHYVRIDKTVKPGPEGNSDWQVGHGGTFSILVTNVSGTGYPMNSGTYTVTEQLPAGMTMTSISGAGTPTSWSCSPSAPQTGPVSITCTFTITYANGAFEPSIAAGDSLPPIVVGVHVDQPPGPEGNYTNCAKLQTDAAGIEGTNPSCTTVAPIFLRPPNFCVEKYSDVDGNGVRDPGEPLLSGWNFTVTDSDGAEVGQLVSGEGGEDCLSPGTGTFTVLEEAQFGWTPTQPASGSQSVTLGPDDSKTVTFGNRPPSQLCVQKFEDLDRDGTQDANEPLLIDWQFNVEGPKEQNPTTTLITTDPDFNCLWLVAGTYTVTEIQQNGWIPTAPASGSQTVVLAANQSELVTFGNARVCCLKFTYMGGKADNFSLSGAAEPADPIPPSTTQSFFDSKKANAIFSHGINLGGSGNCISSAKLTMRVKALPDAANNDTLSLKVPGGASKGLNLTALNGSSWNSSKPALNLSLDLAALPSGNGPTNIITSLNSIRRLNIQVQDDTSIDYIKLTVRFCECGKKKGGAPRHHSM